MVCLAYKLVYLINRPNPTFSSRHRPINIFVSTVIIIITKGDIMLGGQDLFHYVFFTTHLISSRPKTSLGLAQFFNISRGKQELCSQRLSNTEQSFKTVLVINHTIQDTEPEAQLAVVPHNSGPIIEPEESRQIGDSTQLCLIDSSLFHCVT